MVSESVTFPLITVLGRADGLEVEFIELSDSGSPFVDGSAVMVQLCQLKYSCNEIRQSFKDADDDEATC